MDELTRKVNRYRKEVLNSDVSYNKVSEGN